MDKVHIWTEAGLGQAPFRVVRLETTEDRASVQAERKSAGQTYTTNYCSTCDVCGTAIHNVFWIESADGNRFKAGVDCVEKAGNKGMVDTTKKLKAEQKAKLKAEQALVKAQVARIVNDWILQVVDVNVWSGLRELYHTPITNKSQKYRDVVKKIYCESHGEPGSVGYSDAAVIWDTMLSR